ncbi:MAG: hypothetical protein ABIS29_11635 [Vicinamibacterales bacterium]
MVKMTAASMVRHVSYLLAWLLPVWAVIAFFTGGVGWMLGPIRLSSRQPFRPLVIGLAIAGWYAWRYSRAEREADGRWLHRGVARALPFVVPVIIVLALYIGVHYGSFAAGGSDSYGYVSQARFWRGGIPRVEQPWVQDFSWPDREWVFSPLGYRPLSADGTIVPTYPAGLPLMMAAFLAVCGESGPFYVVPVLAAFLLWFTYLLGREATGSHVVGALAALLLLASPVFLAHVMVPMSDVPAAAGWTLVALLALKQRPLAAGIVAGLTLLVRPNLIPLALVPVFAWQQRREPLIQYAAGIVPGLLAVMIINVLLYGGPLTTGYASLFELYAIDSLSTNVRNYAVWLVQTQTPLILLALLPLFVRRALCEDDARVSPRACLAALVGLTFLSYLFYATFDHWFYLRFLLPAYPALFVLLAAAIRWAASRLPAEARVPAAALVCAAMIPFGVNAGRREGIFNVAIYEGRHVRAAREIASRTSADAVVLAVQHSGSVRYYANRITLRYDWLENGALDATLRDLAAKGRRAYLVVDDWEEKEFRARFSPANGAGPLGSPIARVAGSPEVRIFELQGGGPAPTP